MKCEVCGTVGAMLMLVNWPEFKATDMYVCWCCLMKYREMKFKILDHPTESTDSVQLYPPPLTPNPLVEFNTSQTWVFDEKGEYKLLRG